MKKICLIFLIMLAMAVSMTAFSSAYGYPTYRSCGPNPCGSVGYYPAYPATPVRVGGFFGANSAYLIGLRPGIGCGVYPSAPCYSGYYSSYARTGGYYGNYYGYAGGMYNYGYPAAPSVNYLYHGPI